MKRIDVLNEIEQVRLEGYSVPVLTLGRQWERYMWPKDSKQYHVTLKACIRNGCAIVSGGGIEIKCCEGMIQEAAETVAAWCKKVSDRR